VQLYDLIFNILIVASCFVLAAINLFNLGKVKRLITENELLRLKLKECERTGKK